MTTLNYLLEEYTEELELIESEEMHDSDEDEVRERIAMIEFVLDFISKSGCVVSSIDHSAQSEAVYVDFHTPGGSFCKVRFATHFSNYDKDVDFTYDRFQGTYVHATDIAKFKAKCEEIDNDEF